VSKLRGSPKKIICQEWLGKDNEGNDRGLCRELAYIKCNACKQYFCEECWYDHLHMTTEVVGK